MSLRNFKNTDYLGAISSFLCLIHCVATPFLFAAHAYATSGHGVDAPEWWSWLNYGFLLISFVAVYFSVQNTSKSWMKYALYGSWVVLSLLILNEEYEIYHIPEIINYIPALALIVLHLYNRKYCMCGEECAK